MAKEYEWKDYGSEKISDLNMNANVVLIKPAFSAEEQKQYPNLSTQYDFIYIQQTPSMDYNDQGTYERAVGQIDLSDYYSKDQLKSMDMDLGALAAETCPEYCTSYDMHPLKKEAVLEDLDSRGVKVENVVERAEDLGDFKSPVVYHDQSNEEKHIITEKILTMQPGDELSYVLQEQEGKTKYRFACVDKDHVVRFDMDSTNLTKPVKHIDDLTLNKHDLYNSGDLIHRSNKTGPSLNATWNGVEDIKINKGRFTEEEINQLKQGKVIDYNKVAERSHIPDKEEYLLHVLNRSTGKGIDTYEAIHQGTRNPSLSNAEYCEKCGRVQETEMTLTKENTELVPAIKCLREVANEVTHEGLEGQKMALACHATANNLAEGDGIYLALTRAEHDHPAVQKYTDTISDSFEDRFPEIDKGLNTVIDKREAKWFKEREEEKAKQKEMEAKTVTPKKKGIHRKTSSQSLER